MLLRQVPVRNYRNYELFVPLDDLPELPDCLFIGRDVLPEDERDTWLQVRCPRLDNFPEPPPDLLDWLDPSQLGDATLDAPQLLRGGQFGIEGISDDDDNEPLPMADVEPPADIVAKWESYIENQWVPWAERTRPKYGVKRLYDDLFRMYQKQEQMGETYEVAIGFGLLSWRPSASVEIRRHLITAELSLELDPRRQVLSLHPTASGTELRLEEDMLDPAQWPSNELRNRIKEELAEVSASPWEAEGLHDVLATYGHALSSDTVYDRSYAAPTAAPPRPVIAFAPCLLLRKRGNEGLIGLLDAIIDAIDRGMEIPPAVEQQVCIIEKRRRPRNGADAGTDSEESEDDEMYLPLPANKEQQRIVEYLRYGEGVVVEGPPGTGKSHTIANLVCHLLATGNVSW